MIEGFLVLADSASTDQATSKVNLLGAGWSLTGPVIPPAAIAGFLRIPWNEAVDEARFQLRLVDEDGNDVKVPTVNAGLRPVVIEGSMALANASPENEVARKVPLTLSFAMTIPSLPLTPGRAYRWILDVDDVEVASAQFAVRPESRHEELENKRDETALTPEDD
ncbi:DUF6941 family protein [Thermoactinospora rubra]|uniref:DUF6941 family protein n=1 Tax=Thermoactinospora rubra TaxID=1088767 RepID=UPI000A0F577F|nr:hypothetical protein [Thermoactinospora rubra]